MCWIHCIRTRCVDSRDHGAFVWGVGVLRHRQGGHDGSRHEALDGGPWSRSGGACEYGFIALGRVFYSFKERCRKRTAYRGAGVVVQGRVAKGELTIVKVNGGEQRGRRIRKACGETQSGRAHEGLWSCAEEWSLRALSLLRRCVRSSSCTDSFYF